MDEQTMSLRPWLADKWERLIAVEVPDEEDARLGRLFNTLLVISVAIVTAIAMTFVLMYALGMRVFPLGLAAIFPLAFIPIAVFCILQTRRGRIRPMIRFYVWTNFLGISLAILLFDGTRSAGWFLYIWTITIAGTLLAPGYALGMTGGVVGYFLLLLLLTGLGVYRPPLTFGPAGREFASLAFVMIMLVSTVGLLTFLNMRSLRETLGRLRTMARELEEHRRTLEQRVAERTQDLERRSVHLEAAAQVAREAAAIRDVNQLMDTTVRLISERFGFYHAGIFLIDEAGEYAVLRAASSEGGGRMLTRGHKLKVGEVGIVGWVAGTGEPRVALDVGEDAVFFDNPDLPETRSEMALPLKVRGRIIGVLDVQSTEPAAFTDEDVSILQTLADQVALAIENAHLLEESQRALRELQLAYGEYVRAAWKALEAPTALVYDRVEVVPTGLPPEPLVEKALQTREVVTATDPEHKRSALVAPLRLRDQVIGVIGLEETDEARPWTEEEIELVKAVSEQVALALENARLFAEAQQRLQELQDAYEEQARLAATVRELSTPVIQVWENVLVLPLIGTIDAARAARIMEDLLTGIVRYQAEMIILDLTGVPMVDTDTAHYLMQTIKAAGLLGAQTILVGIRSEMAQTITSLGVELQGIPVLANLRAGIEYALAQMGFQVAPVSE